MNIPRSILIAIAIIVTVIGIAYVVQEKDNPVRSSKKTNPFDTLNYGEADYNLMRSYFNSDTAFLSTLNLKIEEGDTNAVRAKKLLNTPYSMRETLGVEESEIDAMIYSYYISKEVKEKFNEIERRLIEETSPKTASDSAIDKYIDSVRHLIKEKPGR